MDSIGLVLFPRFTGLDLVGPHEVLSRTSATCSIVAATRDPVISDRGLVVVPDATFDDAPDFDVLVVPGGPGQTPAMDDDVLIAFIRERASAARFVLGVCTGTLLLARAGILNGREATTHWLALEALEALGARAVRERVVWSDHIVTGAGVSAGIDAALELVARMYGDETSERIQLAIEYDPAPPHDVGHPDKARPALVAALRSKSRFQ